MDVPPTPTVPMSDATTLKRKEREEEEVVAQTLYGSSTKRIALDLEQLNQQLEREDLERTAPAIGDNDHEMEYDNYADELRPVAHKDSDPTYVLFRMYCQVKEASTIVGKRGDTINHIREKANVRINVLENLKNVPERIVTVRGPAENVARAFGLITRVLLDEPEDEPYSVMLKQYQLKLLIPHPLVGYVIGKLGLKFREIEEKLAAKLKAAEQPLPFSTDRILSITGVGDAIHIAVYYVAQEILERKDCLKKLKVLYYNPVNFHHANLQMTMMPPNPMANVNPMTMQPRHDIYNKPPVANYNFGMMFQPAVQPPFVLPPAAVLPAPAVVPPQQTYQDEHGNTLIGEVIINPPVPLGTSADKFNQDVFVANTLIGLVIGKGGNNIKHIRENSQCTYVRIEPDKGQSMMIGGKGLTNVRKLTLTGTLQAINTAVYLINQRIQVDKERNAHP